MHAAPHSASNTYRSRRFRRFAAMVSDLLARSGACRIIDIGGEPGYWRAYGSELLRDPRVTIAMVNYRVTDADRAALAGPGEERMSLREGDARDLRDVAAGAFDLAHSNSVIEHVGGWNDQRAMAGEVLRVARAHFVQTPFWGFPLDPHSRTPFLHWLPDQLRYRLHRRRGFGFYPRGEDVHAAMGSTQDARMLDRPQFAALFPDSTIFTESVAGLTKSLIAVGGEGHPRDPRSNARALKV